MIIRQKVYLMQLLCLLIFSPLLHAQDIVVREIPSLDKLPVNAIHRIFQDSDGYMCTALSTVSAETTDTISAFSAPICITRDSYRIIILLISPKTTTKKSGSEP